VIVEIVIVVGGEAGASAAGDCVDGSGTLSFVRQSMSVSVDMGDSFETSMSSGDESSRITSIKLSSFSSSSAVFSLADDIIFVSSTFSLTLGTFIDTVVIDSEFVNSTGGDDATIAGSMTIFNV
jgi:hypothetical protein